MNKMPQLEQYDFKNNSYTKAKWFLLLITSQLTHKHFRNYNQLLQALMYPVVSFFYMIKELQFFKILKK